MKIVRHLTYLARLTKDLRIWLMLGFALLATSALSRFEAQDINVESICDDRLFVSWDVPPGPEGYLFTPVNGMGGGRGEIRCSDSEPNCIITGLKRRQTYSYYLDRVTSDGVEYGNAIHLKGPSTGSCPEYIVATPTPRPPVNTCANLPADIIVSGFSPFATQCQLVGSAGVGNDGLIAQGILSAVDVWSYVTPGIEVCFAQPGRIVFLDAAYMPRQLFDLPAHSRDGLSCATTNRAGTVILLRGDSSEPPTQTQILNGCEVRPFTNVKFRESPPDGAVIYVTGRREWLPASEKHRGYFKIRLWAIDGWISGDYVDTRGNCGG